jgi:hypothetical protein
MLLSRGSPCTVAARKKIGAERRENVFDAHTSKDGKELKVVLLHLWHVNIKTTRGFIYIPLKDFHKVKTAP